MEDNPGAAGRHKSIYQVDQSEKWNKAKRRETRISPPESAGEWQSIRGYVTSQTTTRQRRAFMHHQERAIPPNPARRLRVRLETGSLDKILPARYVGHLLNRLQTMTKAVC